MFRDQDLKFPYPIFSNFANRYLLSDIHYSLRFSISKFLISYPYFAIFSYFSTSIFFIRYPIFAYFFLFFPLQYSHLLSDIGIFPVSYFDIPHSLFDIRYSLSDIRYFFLISPLQYSLFVIRYSLFFPNFSTSIFFIRYPIFAIFSYFSHFNIPHLLSDIWYFSRFLFRYSSFVIRYSIFVIRYSLFFPNFSTSIFFIRYPIFAIFSYFSHFNIPHLLSDIWYFSRFLFRYSSFVIRYSIFVTLPSSNPSLHYQSRTALHYHPVSH
jgi:hypothetical protein